MRRLAAAAGSLALALTLALLAGGGPGALAAPPPADAPRDAEADYEHAISTILCDCGCHPQSVKECACGRAAEMRREIAALVAGTGGPPDWPPPEGPMGGEAIVAAYVERYGDQIRISPTAEGFNLVAWLGPLVGLLAATAMLWLVIGRWSRVRHAGAGAASGGAAGPEAAGVAAAAPGAPRVPRADEAGYRERLRRELEELG